MGDVDLVGDLEPQRSESAHITEDSNIDSVEMLGLEGWSDE